MLFGNLRIWWIWERIENLPYICVACTIFGIIFAHLEIYKQRNESNDGWHVLIGLVLTFCVEKVMEVLHGLDTDSYIAGFSKVKYFGQEGSPFSNGGSVTAGIYLLLLLEDTYEVSSILPQCWDTQRFERDISNWACTWFDEKIGQSYPTIRTSFLVMQWHMCKKVSPKCWISGIQTVCNTSELFMMIIVWSSLSTLSLKIGYRIKSFWWENQFHGN